MKILLVTQYFWPESFLINDLVKTLDSLGHTIEVLTGKPNYPEGQLFEGYNQKGYYKDVYNGNTVVHRVPLRPRKEGGGLNLCLNYLSFIVNGLLYSSKITKRSSIDIIFVFAPSPILTAIPAIYIKYRSQIPLVIWVQDLWPESLKATGFIHNRFVLKAVGYIVKGIYFCSDSILVQSKAFINSISKSVKEEKLKYYPNSFLDQGGKLLKDSTIPQELLMVLDNSFCVIFAGNLGAAQSMSTITSAAKLLKHRPEIKIVLVGSGSKLHWVIEQKKINELENLIIAGRYSSSEMPIFFSRAAGLLVTLTNDTIFTQTVPSKLQAYLASGRPIIGALDGEGARVIDEAGAGLTCNAEDPEGLARNIEHLFSMSSQERKKLGESGREYFLRNFEMVSQARKLVEIFTGLQMKNTKSWK